MEKIILIGSGGAGKSTFAKQLGESLKIPVVHLDAEYWSPGWKKPKKETWLNRLQELMEPDRWILDGNYSSSMDFRIEAADTVIYFDYTRYLCLYRVLKRFFQYRNRSRPDMREGCNERLNVDFLRWVWNYRKNRRPIILEKLKKYQSEKEIIIFQKSKDARNFLQALPKNKY